MWAAQIIDAVEKRLRRSHRGRRTVYRREWPIAAGATRIDFAAINGEITGCEIKSSRDNFSRLASQVPLYSAVLDTAVLVVEGDQATRRADSAVPSWWGIWQASETSRGVTLRIIRPHCLNPCPDPLSVAQLVLRDEAYAILKKYDLAAGFRTSTRWRLWNRLAEELPLETLQSEVREAIKARQQW
ncbi:sce7726 family protein [Saccharothrix sp. NRRL B-16314]|uniref:sce7726 family protein n=1 Tax=Saccharothrix sp. NRRL B-16314 TaxID=1463825 RepID=UPI0012DF74A8